MSTQELNNIRETWPTLESFVYVPHTEAEYRQLVASLDQLLDEVGEDEQHPLASLVEVIGVLIQRYEVQHVPLLRVKNHL